MYNNKREENMNTQEQKKESIYTNLIGGEGNARTWCLAQELNIDEKDVDVEYNEHNEDYTFKVGDKEYKVLTDKESNKEVKEYIRETLWAFTPTFLEDHSTKFDLDHFKKVQELCEDANEIVFNMIDDFDELVEDAIDQDGRGHFLSTYDGHENSQDWNGESFYIYRTN